MILTCHDFVRYFNLLHNGWKKHSDICDDKCIYVIIVFEDNCIHVIINTPLSYC